MKTLEAFLAREPDGVVIEVTETKGSVPRDTGTWMLIGTSTQYRTIGGGALEYRAIEIARNWQAGETHQSEHELALGPESGQCCGGRIVFKLSKVNDVGRETLLLRERDEDITNPVVNIFGAGNVGLALRDAFALLPVQTRLYDHRDGFDGVALAAPEQVVRDTGSIAAHIVTTHDHGLDFLIVGEALAQGDAVYVGMIGSNTKRARFESWLKQEMPGVSAHELHCPMGASVAVDKRPQVIAAHVVSEVMTAFAKGKGA